MDNSCEKILQEMSAAHIKQSHFNYATLCYNHMCQTGVKKICFSKKHVLKEIHYYYGYKR